MGWLKMKIHQRSTSKIVFAWMLLFFFQPRSCALMLFTSCLQITIYQVTSNFFILFHIVYAKINETLHVITKLLLPYIYFPWICWNYWVTLIVSIVKTCNLIIYTSMELMQFHALTKLLFSDQTIMSLPNYLVQPMVKAYSVVQVYG